MALPKILGPERNTTVYSCGMCGHSRGQHGPCPACRYDPDRRFQIRARTPNGQPGAVALYLGPLTIVLGYEASVRGLDILWKDTFVYTTGGRLD